MPDLWMDVDAALSEVPVCKAALIDDTDFKAREESVTYDQAGLDLLWNFVTTAGVMSQTAVTPTDTGGDYDWVNQGNGMYSIEIPADSGASINNDTEGFGWFSGYATGILPWIGPVIGFRAAALNNALIDGGDTLDVNVTAMAANAVTAAAIADAAIDNATFAADVGSTAYATNIIALAVRKVLDEIKLDHLVAVADADDVVDSSIIAKLASKGATPDWSTFVNTTDSLEAVRDAITDANPQNHSAAANNETTGTLESGTYADTASVNTTYYQTAPAGAAVGGFGLNVDLTFNIGTGRVPDQITVTGYFGSGALRTVQVWAYDYNLAAYVQLSSSANDFNNGVANQTFQYPLTNNMRQVSDGEVKIRFTSESITVTDDWYCDYVNITSVAQEAAGLTADAIQEAVWSRADSGHDENTLGYNVSKQHLVHGDIASATSASQFILDTGIGNNDAYNGMVIVLEDATDSHSEVRRIVDYIGATKEVFVDRAFSFTPVADDVFYIMNAAYADVNVTHVQATAQTALDLNDILDDTAEIGAAGVGLTEAGGDGDHLTEAGGDGDHLTEAGGDGDHLTEVSPADASISSSTYAANARDAAGQAADVSNENADALLDRANGIETSYTPRQALRLILSALVGKLSGAATTTVAIRDIGDSKDRITATVDADGNRTAVTPDAT